MSPPLDPTPFAWPQGPEIELLFLPGPNAWPAVPSTSPESYHFNHSDEMGRLWGGPLLPPLRVAAVSMAPGSQGRVGSRVEALRGASVPTPVLGR